MSNEHPWCSDVARDTAIRAAEDAAAKERPPLPDHRELPERVARLEAAVFASKTNHDAAPTAGGGDSQCAGHATIGGTQSGLRTERVTLEVTTTLGHPESWDWPSILEDRILVHRIGESVRVVPSSEADAEVERLRVALADAIRRPMGVIPNSADGLVTQKELDEAEMRRPRNIPRTVLVEQLTDERDAAISERNAALARVEELEKQHADASRIAYTLTGTATDKYHEAKDAVTVLLASARQQADAEPVAWGVLADDESIHSLCLTEDRVRRVAEKSEAVVPLFRAPPPPRGWLTAKEREAVRRAASVMSEEYHHGPTDNEAASVLRALLSRSSPPRVRLPEKEWWVDSNVRHYRVNDVRAALAKAGVEVEG